jgi:hypothetical protein
VAVTVTRNGQHNVVGGYCLQMGMGSREHVCCLACANVYSRPSCGGTYERNPGCPRCGYLGWTAVPLRRESAAAPARLIRLTPPK